MIKYGKSKDETSKALDPQFPSQIRNEAQNSDGNVISQTNQPFSPKPNCFKILNEIELISHNKEPKEPFILEDEEEESEETKQQRLSRLRRFAQQRRTQSASLHSCFGTFINKQIPNIIARKITKDKNKNELMNNSTDKKNNPEIPVIVKNQEKTQKKNDSFFQN